MKRILSAILVAGLFVSLPAYAIDIIDLHQNDASGVPTMLGQTVTVTGVVTVPKMVFSDYSLEIYIQDATAGINIYVSSAIDDYEAALGDSLTVTAPVAHYQGLTELGTASADVTIVNHGPASVIPDPMVITCAEMNASYLADNTEPNESRLIRINGVTIDSGTWPTVPSSSNSFIDIDDGTGIGLLFIDKDCEVNGSPAPTGSFDVIGILKQYDSSSPHTDGYEILPRYIGDVVVDIPGPPILGFPLVRNVTQTSVDILFETLDPGSSEVEYGLDDSYGNTAGDAGASETDHLVPLSGLTPGTLYHFRVKSTDSSGTNYSDDRVLVTASAIPGQIHIAMSNSADHSYADGENVAENQNISQIVSDLIGMATVSVDAAMYSFSTTNVRDALIDAHQRGCQVRIIIDANNSSSYADQCAAYGIPYIRSTFAGNHGADENYGYMHNKFIVIDGFDVDTGNNWVWAGSANLSYSGDGDTNNTFRIQDYGLSQAYT
ncbi:MAG: phospholipase D-like domain-containing protein, partial [Candidatus Krumholzibacteria bacterium]|nr:phospholipase D-like domain-containing protein [Candidatus Krumholzibacteria bacterium]